MKLTGYFIRHPVIAVIFNLMLVVLGILSFKALSLREYPNIVFPTISVSTSYPNASSDLVESSVSSVLEDRLAGIEGLEYMTSESTSGFSYIKLYFKPKIRMDAAVNAVQDGIATAKAFLPQDVKAPIVERRKKTTGLPFIALAVESKGRSFGALTHFANLNLKNVFRATPGVANVDIWGQPYAYHISLDPGKLFAFGVNAHEVIHAIEKAKISLPAGNYQNKIPATIQLALKSVKDYENVLVKADVQHPVFLKSLAHVQLVSDDSQTRLHVNGHDGIILSINRAEDSNPLSVSTDVKRTLKTVEANLPPDLKVRVILDQSDFIRASLRNITSAIIEAIALVLIIVFLFLRNFRATLIPLVTIPISLLGSLIFLKIMGYSINMMTMLAMVLGVGLVVDDAIVVLENIWRYIEDGMKPQEAAIKGARQIGFAIVAMTLTLASVYLPLAFIEGMLGQLFIEFAVALAGSVIISGVVALTLSPVMCSFCLRHDAKTYWQGLDRMFNRLTIWYQNGLTYTLVYQKVPLSLGLASVVGTLLLVYNMNYDIAPKEDRGLIGVFIPAVSGENLDGLSHQVERIEHEVQDLPEARNRLAFMGDWGANVLLPLKSHQARDKSAETLVNILKKKLGQIPSVDPVVWSWDKGLPGVDNAGVGAELTLMVSTPGGYKQLFEEMEKLKKIFDDSGLFASASFELRLDSMGYVITLDRQKMAKLGLSPAEVAKTIEIFFSGDVSQTFDKDGVIYPVKISGKKSPWTLDTLYLTTPKGRRVSLGAVAQMVYKPKPALLEHYQQMRSTTLHVQLKPTQSMSENMSVVWKMAKSNLPKAYQLAWMGAAKKLQETSNTMFYLMFLSLLFIYAILCAQFENFVDPFIILLTVPLACCGALLFAWGFHQSLNIYTQIGLITLVGLISKHGILIVSFANELQKQGLSLMSAVKQAAGLRLRPVLMTTGAMLFGAIPLVLSHDAGSEARNAIGLILIGGLSLGTLFTLFVLPTVYYIIKSSCGRAQA